MTNKTTDELLHILEDCQDEQELKEILTQMPDISSLTVKGYLEQLLQEKGIKKSEVIHTANLPRTYGYQIFQGTKKPGRDKLIAIAFALHLSVEQCNRLLTIAGLCILYSKNRRDAIILFCLERNLDYSEVEELLFEMKEPTLAE